MLDIKLQAVAYLFPKAANLLDTLSSNILFTETFFFRCRDCWIKMGTETKTSCIEPFCILCASYCYRMESISKHFLLSWIKLVKPIEACPATHSVWEQEKYALKMHNVNFVYGFHITYY